MKKCYFKIIDAILLLISSTYTKWSKREVSLLIKRSMCLDSCRKLFWNVLPCGNAAEICCVDTVGPACTFITFPKIANQNILSNNNNNNNDNTAVILGFFSAPSGGGGGKKVCFVVFLAAKFWKISSDNEDYLSVIWGNFKLNKQQQQKYARRLWV